MEDPSPAPEDTTPRLRIAVDWEELALAVENQLPDFTAYLDLDTGQVVTFSCETLEESQQTDRMVFIEPRSSREGYRTMQRFLDEVEDPLAHDKLAATLVGKGAFRRFKDALIEFPELRQRWFAFKDAEVFAYIREWLEENGIEPTNSPPDPASRERTVPPALSRISRRGMTPVVAPASGDEPDWREAVRAFDRPECVFTPERSALLIIDMQRTFVHEQGRNFLPLSRPMLPRLAALLERWRERRLPVLFTRHVHRRAEEDGGALSRWWNSLILERDPDSALLEPFVPANGERLITKSRYSAFAGTELLWVLRNLSVRDLVIGGVLTNLCCETTARDAFVNDFNVFFLGDGTAASDPELHLASCRNIAYGFGRVLGVEDALVRLGRGGSDGGAARE